MAIEIASLVAAVGGEVIGKIRLQKIVYLLDRIGLDSGFSYSYHHYGPFSSALSDVADIEASFGDLMEEQRNRVSDGVPYIIFKSSRSLDSYDKVGGLSVNDISLYSNIMDSYTSTELELAATAFWLAKEEEISDWRTELKKRKGVKTEGGRTERAVELLIKLGLELA
jgi:uncharacterized protein YwgA